MSLILVAVPALWLTACVLVVSLCCLARAGDDAERAHDGLGVTPRVEAADEQRFERERRALSRVA
jgi:hypothetical protein